MTTPATDNKISKSRGSLGVRSMPDRLDSGGCFLRDTSPGVVRVNIDGIWSVLCAEHRDALASFLSDPLPAPTEATSATKGDNG